MLNLHRAVFIIPPPRSSHWVREHMLLYIRRAWLRPEQGSPVTLALDLTIGVLAQLEERRAKSGRYHVNELTNKLLEASS